MDLMRKTISSGSAFESMNEYVRLSTKLCKESTKNILQTIVKRRQVCQGSCRTCGEPLTQLLGVEGIRSSGMARGGHLTLNENLRTHRGTHTHIHTDAQTQTQRQRVGESTEDGSGLLDEWMGGWWLVAGRPPQGVDGYRHYPHAPLKLMPGARE